MKAVRFDKPGGPEVMRLVDVNIEEPAAGQVRVRQTAVGLNFIDTYHRSGLYPVPLPSGLGLEAAGVVEALGEGVTSLAVGDRVSYGNGPIGAYAQAVNVPANRISKIPDGISDDTAAAMMLKGMTVRYLLRRTYEVEAGDTILLHAAAGGIGLIAIQWAKALGATVIGTVGSEDKAELAKAHGCDHIILYKTEDVAKKVREITGGKGVPVVYDGVGQAVVDASLDSLQPFGLWVNFGNASGPVTNFNLGVLSAKGSLYVTRPTLMTYVARDEDLRETAGELFDMVGSGKVKIEINQRYGLSEVRKAHEDLEARRTTGTTIFLPDE